MSNQSNTIDQFFDKQFEQELSNAGSNVLVAYDGVLNSETISKLEAEIEGKILDKNLPKSVVRKVFFICVETLQNMLLHGFKDENGAQHNYIVLSISPTHLVLNTANLVGNSVVPKLTNDINTINSFDDPAKLKEYYLEHLENNELSDKGGAGLGFITIAMKSGNKLGANFNSLNDKFSHFALEAKINIE